MKKTKQSATAFIRKRKEKWRPSLTGSEDMNEGSTGSRDNQYCPSPTTPRSPTSQFPLNPQDSDSINLSVYDDGGSEEGSFIVDGQEPSNASNSPTSKKGLENYVGFANLPNQVFRKSVKKGFQFTLMVVGESGLGKSTLINSLFLTDVYASATYEDASSKFGKTMSVNASTFELKEGGVRLQLTVVDTPGFGDNIDNTDCWNSVIQNIESKFEDYLNAESRVNRTAVQDTRVHCCLYFIAPTGHGLKPLDVEFMKKLHKKVNIVPVIAKADTLTADECYKFKQQILKEIEENQINIYRFPPLSEDESENDLQSLRRIPFAVVGSNTVLEVGGKKIRGRKYPWGIVEVENIEHCDFIALRNLLIRTHMQDLIDVTNDVHYENFRSERLSVLTGGGSSITSAALNINPMDQIEREREDQEKKLKKMEQEMEQVFEMKVREKKQKLKDSEAEFNRKFEVTMKTLDQSRLELEERRRKFELEREQFETQHHLKDLDSSRSGSRSSLKKGLLRKNRSPDLCSNETRKIPAVKSLSLPSSIFHPSNEVDNFYLSPKNWNGQQQQLHGVNNGLNTSCDVINPIASLPTDEIVTFQLMNVLETRESTIVNMSVDLVDAEKVFTLKEISLTDSIGEKESEFNKPDNHDTTTNGLATNSLSLDLIDKLGYILAQGSIVSNIDVMESEIETPGEEENITNSKQTHKEKAIHNDACLSENAFVNKHSDSDHLVSISQTPTIYRSVESTISQESLFKKTEEMISLADKNESILNDLPANGKKIKLSKRDSKGSTENSKRGGISSLFCVKRPGEKDKKKQKKFF